MITFTDPADRELLAELKEVGLVTPVVMERIHAELGRAEQVSFDRFLLAGADCIPEREWLSWLIRRHHCFRFGPVRLAGDAATWAQSARTDLHHLDGDPPPNLPYARRPAGGYLIAILRPDHPTTGWRAAGTLRELAQLRLDWLRLRIE